MFCFPVSLVAGVQCLLVEHLLVEERGEEDGEEGTRRFSVKSRA